MASISSRLTLALGGARRSMTVARFQEAAWCKGASAAVHGQHDFGHVDVC